MNTVYSGSSGQANLLLGWVPGTVTLGTNANGVFTVSSDDNNYYYYTSNSNFSGGTAALQLNGTTANINGDLVNTSSTYSPYGEAASGVVLNYGANLTVNNLTNSATTSSIYDLADAEVDLSAGSSLTVNGNVQQHGHQNSSAGDGFPYASINLENSTLAVNATQSSAGTFNNTSALLSMLSGSTATVAGLFTNDVNSEVILDSSQQPSSRVSSVSTLTNNTNLGGSTLTTSSGFSNAGQVYINDGSILNNTGLFSNSGAVGLWSNSALNNTGLFNNTYTGTVTLDYSSTLTNTGNFKNTGFVTTGSETSSAGNAVNVTGAIFNTSAGVVNLEGAGDTMTATQQFINRGAVNLSGTSAGVSSNGFANKYTGTIALSGTGNTVTSSSWMSNSGMITFSGTNGQISSTGNFTNNAAGIVTMGGSDDVLFTLGSSNISNAGTVTIGSGEFVIAGINVTQQGTVAGGSYTQTAGTTTIDSGGVLQAVLVDIQGGTLTGGGTIEGNLTVEDGGTLSPATAIDRCHRQLRPNRDRHT